MPHPSDPTGIWLFCDPLGPIPDAPVRVVDADWLSITVNGQQLGFVDYPLGKGRFEARIAVLGRIVGQRDGLFVVRFRDGQEGRFGTLAGWQLEFPRVKVRPNWLTP